MLTKSCPAKVKAVGPDDQLGDGVFEAVVSVFGNRDSYGDIVLPGAFTDTLAEWAAKGDPIPVYWSHRMDDPDFNIGYVLEAKETEQGLWVKAQIDLDETASKARQAYRLLKGRRVTQFSFAYDVDEGAWVEKDDEHFYELRKLKLHEVGPTPIGANDQTELLTVKAAAHAARHLADGIKAGRVLSSKNETELRSAHESISRVLSALDDVEEIDDTKSGTTPSGTSGSGSTTSNDRDATAGAPAKDEDRDGGKSEEPKHRSPADLSALQRDLQLADLDIT